MFIGSGSIIEDASRLHATSMYPISDPESWMFKSSQSLLQTWSNSRLQLIVTLSSLFPLPSRVTGKITSQALRDT